MNEKQMRALLEELLEIEEKNDVGNLTRKERAEFQEYVKSAFDKKAEELDIDVPEGRLHVEIATDSSNPGVYVELYPSGDDYPLTIALVEHNSLANRLSTFVWGNAMQEDYTQKISLCNLEGYLKMVEYEKQKEERD